MELAPGAGSPPRMRGKVAGNLEQGRVVGITPAYAGKRLSRPAGFAETRDHPRVCGEKSGTWAFIRSTTGSPPRMRGKVKGCGFLALAVRITPAYAGKRGSGSLPRSCRRDHPRVCGEKVLLYSGLLYPLGSPPRVRGKGFGSFQAAGPLRITPACAGKSFGCPQPAFYTGDHPRVCGEKRFSAVFHLATSGSPPRVRGKVYPGDTTNKSQGITPACAGKRKWHPRTA